MGNLFELPRPAFSVTAELGRLKWQPIETYDGSDAMLRSDAHCVFGCRGPVASLALIGTDLVSAANDGEPMWGQLIDGEFIPMLDFQPTEWAPASRQLAAAMMMM